MQHTDSPAAMQIAEQRHVFAFGQDSDMIKFGPHSQLTSIVDNWAPYYIARAKAVIDGTWKSQDTWGGLKSKMVVMAPFTNMPDDVKKLAEKTEAGIKDGSILPFKCPVYAQDGKEVPCKGGKSLSDGQILGMNFYVKGHRREVPGEVSGHEPKRSPSLPRLRGRVASEASRVGVRLRHLRVNPTPIALCAIGPPPSGEGLDRVLGVALA